jgi:leader peptidase (prepilin peptidase) / N-methyltransferase
MYGHHRDVAGRSSMIVLGQPFDAALVFVVGLVFGSLASVLSHRLPLGHGVLARRSACRQCGAALGVVDLVPLLSWLALRGRCRHCGETIGARYPIIELTTAFVFLAAWLASGLGPAFPMLAALGVILIVLCVVDIDYGYLPNPLQLAAAVLAPGWWMSQIDPSAAALSGTIAGLLLMGLGLVLRWVFARLRGREVLGMGDVKLLGVAGLWLGMAPAPAFLILAGFLGVVVAFIWRVTGRGPEFPFGPALALALYLCLVLPGLGAMV